MDARIQTKDGIFLESDIKETTTFLDLKKKINIDKDIPLTYNFYFFGTQIEDENKFIKEFIDLGSNTFVLLPPRPKSEKEDKIVDQKFRNPKPGDRDVFLITGPTKKDNQDFQCLHLFPGRNTKISLKETKFGIAYHKEGEGFGKRNFHVQHFDTQQAGCKVEIHSNEDPTDNVVQIMPEEDKPEEEPKQLIGVPRTYDENSLDNTTHNFGQTMLAMVLGEVAEPMKKIAQKAPVLEKKVPHYTPDGNSFSIGEIRIENQYRELMFAITEKESEVALSREDIHQLKTNWQLMLSILLHSLSTNLINMTTESSFFRIGEYDLDYITLTSLKTLTTFAKMKAFGIKELQFAFSHIGIAAALPKENELNKDSEAIFCLTLDNKTGKELDPEETNRLQEMIINGINETLSSPTKLEWLNDLLKEEETVTEYVKKHKTIDFNKIQINVHKPFPGSVKVFVQLKFLDLPKDPEEVNCILKVLKNLLENLPSVTKARVDNTTDVMRNDGILRMKIQVGDNWLGGNNRKQLDAFLKNFIEDIRMTIKSDEIIKQQEKLLNKKGMTPASITQFLENLYKPDKLEFQLEPCKTYNVDVSRYQNIPLWPSDKRKLGDLSGEDRFIITESFIKNMDKRVWEDVYSKFALLRNEDLRLATQREISRLQEDTSPYPIILDKYKTHDGTIGGVLECLDKCRNDKEVTSSMQEKKDKIQDMITTIQVLKEKHFHQWLETYKEEIKIPDSWIANYDAFRKAAPNSRKAKRLLMDNARYMTDEMKNEMEEGDQVWMWRERSFAISYAHVGIFVGDGCMVHVSSEGLSGIIKKEPIEQVVKQSRCFIVRPIPNNEIMAGTPKVLSLPSYFIL